MTDSTIGYLSAMTAPTLANLLEDRLYVGYLLAYINMTDTTSAIC